jgi:hypothetical protein
MNIRCTMGLCATLMIALPITLTAEAKEPVTGAASSKPAAPRLVLPNLTAAQIVERNTAARGGLSAWRHVHSMTMTGKLDAGKTRRDGGAVAMNPVMRKARERKALLQSAQNSDVGKVIQLPFQMDLQRPVKSRLEIPFQGQTSVQVYDGTQGWKLRPFLGRHEVEPFTPEEMSLAAGQLPLDGALIDSDSKGIKVALDGAEPVEGQNAYRLKLTLKDGEVRHLWVDAKSFLELKVEAAPRKINGKLRPLTTFFRDYKAEDGLMVAHRLETVVQGIPGSENIYIEKIVINPPLSDARFAKLQ